MKGKKMFGIKIRPGRIEKLGRLERIWWVVSHTHPNKQGNYNMYASRLLSWVTLRDTVTGEIYRTEGEGDPWQQLHVFYVLPGVSYYNSYPVK